MKFQHLRVLREAICTCKIKRSPFNLSPQTYSRPFYEQLVPIDDSDFVSFNADTFVVKSSFIDSLKLLTDGIIFQNSAVLHAIHLEVILGAIFRLLNIKLCVCQLQGTHTIRYFVYAKLAILIVEVVTRLKTGALYVESFRGISSSA